MYMIPLTQVGVIFNMTFPAVLFVYKDNLQPTPRLNVPHRDNTGKTCMPFICLNLTLSATVLINSASLLNVLVQCPIFIA
jgi:hypothetical protein